MRRQVWSMRDFRDDALLYSVVTSSYYFMVKRKQPMNRPLYDVYDWTSSRFVPIQIKSYTLRQQAEMYKADSIILNNM